MISEYPLRLEVFIATQVPEPGPGAPMVSYPSMGTAIRLAQSGGLASLARSGGLDFRGPKRAWVSTCKAA